MDHPSVNQDTLWAPWRYDYVSGNSDSDNQEPAPEPMRWQPAAEETCFLCRAAADYSEQSSVDRNNLVVWRSDVVCVVLNRFPYNNGHLLISPLQHVGPLANLSANQKLACLDMLALLTNIYAEQIQATGFNIGLNLGEAAGAGVPGHLHWHLVPRWPGDQNFMPVTGNTHVIPQSLDSLWCLLSEALKEVQS